MLVPMENSFSLGQNLICCIIWQHPFGRESLLFSFKLQFSTMAAHNTAILGFFFSFNLTYHHITPFMLHMLIISTCLRSFYCGLTSYVDPINSFSWFCFCFYWMILPTPLLVVEFSIQVVIFQVGISLFRLCYSTFTSQVKSDFFPILFLYFSFPIFSDKEGSDSAW